MKNLLIKDSRGREIVRINNKGQIVIARYPDMNEQFKKYVTDLYSELTGKSKKEIVNFLNYKTEENEFCS
jgi:glucose-6-phosphate isomerase